MARIARIVVPGLPHHVIQRGNRRQKVFFSDEDKLLYLKILRAQAEKKSLQFLAYCLMDNHVHFIVIPRFQESLSCGLGETHRRYTNLINIRENWKGYLWQGRFLSYPLDDSHLIAATRYVELNPVRAGIVRRAEDYRWSSARAHVLKIKDELVSGGNLPSFFTNWADFLNKNDMDAEETLLRKHAKTGRPLGDDGFIRDLERITGRALLIRRPGRKPRK